MPNFRLVDDTTPEFSPEQQEFLDQFGDKFKTTTDPEMSNRLLGRSLIALTELCGFPAHRAWRICRSDSKTDDTGAARQCRRWKKWYRERYPLTITDAFEVAGVTIEDMVRMSVELANTKKLRWDSEKGEYVETRFIDPSARNMGLNHFHRFMSLDAQVRKEAVLGREEKPTRLNLPPTANSIQEWEEWAQEQEKGVLAERTKAAEEMKLIAEGQRAKRELGDKATEEMKDIAEGQRALREKGARARPDIGESDDRG